MFHDHYCYNASHILLTHFGYFCIYIFLLPIYRALVRSMGEILFMCGSNRRAVIATLAAIGCDAEGSAQDDVSWIRSDVKVFFSIEFHIWLK